MKAVASRVLSFKFGPVLEVRFYVKNCDYLYIGEDFNKPKRRFEKVNPYKIIQIEQFRNDLYVIFNLLTIK